MNRALIEENIAKIRAELAALSAGREVCLLAATKTRGAEEIQAAYAAGIDAAGENRAQEFSEKFAHGAYAGRDVQFIGHLQTNKVKARRGKCFPYPVRGLRTAAARRRRAGGGAAHRTGRIGGSQYWKGA